MLDANGKPTVLCPGDILVFETERGYLRVQRGGEYLHFHSSDESDEPERYYGLSHIPPSHFSYRDIISFICVLQYLAWEEIECETGRRHVYLIKER